MFGIKINLFKVKLNFSKIFLLKKCYEIYNVTHLILKKTHTLYHTYNKKNYL